MKRRRTTGSVKKRREKFRVEKSTLREDTG
jgi:hypothetical protein